MNKLFIVATPIGNIKDISENAKNTLMNVNYFFCEDTRVTKKLFNLLNISILNKYFFNLTSYNEKKIVDNFKWESKNDYALLSDAGYPLISDPGYYLVAECIKRNINIEIINGPCSIIHSIVKSGFPCNNFYFAGFLPKKINEKRKELLNLSKINTTLIIYESVHEIKKTLQLLDCFFDKENICIAKELTKKYEKFIYYNEFKNNNIDTFMNNGEFIILVNNSIVKNCINQENIIFEISTLIKKGNSEKNACKIIAYKYDLKPNNLFNLYKQK